LSTSVDGSLYIGIGNDFVMVQIVNVCSAVIRAHRQAKASPSSRDRSLSGELMCNVGCSFNYHRPYGSYCTSTVVVRGIIIKAYTIHTTISRDDTNWFYWVPPCTLPTNHTKITELFMYVLLETISTYIK